MLICIFNKTKWIWAEYSLKYKNPNFGFFSIKIDKNQKIAK